MSISRTARSSKEQAPGICGCLRDSLRHCSASQAASVPSHLLRLPVQSASSRGKRYAVS